MSGPSTVSVVGLGLMGHPMARRLAAAGFEVTGWNRSPKPLEPGTGLTLVPELADAAASETILLVLSDSDAVGEVLASLEPMLAAGQVVVDLGSSSPLDSVARAESLAARGVGWVDAPVSGGAVGAESGRLAIMAGGTEEDVRHAMPVLRALGSSVVRVGGPGAGHTAKIVNQVIVGLALEAVAEGLAIAEAAGLDPALVQEALRGGWADSRILQEQGSRMVARDFAPGGKARTIRKDLAMALDLARELELELPHARSAYDIFDGLVAEGRGDLDCAVVFSRLRPAAPPGGPGL